MLIQLYRDNYSTVPTENLITTIYDGFFDGVENWFNTATVVNTDLRVSNLTDLNTITRNQFVSTITRSIKVSGFFRAKKTGTYRFFTYSNDKNILEIDGDDIIVNTGLNQINFSNKSLIAGRYYSFNLYYGNRVLQYPPAQLTGGTTDIQNQTYGNGSYIVNASSSGSNRWFAFDYTNIYWRSLANYNADGSYKNTFSTNTVQQGLIYGEWLEIKLPESILLEKFFINNRASTVKPRKVKILGGNDGTTWNIIYETDLLSHATNTGSTITLNPLPNEKYSYYRFVAMTGGSSYIEIMEWRLYAKSDLECGYLEPNDDGTNGGSTNPDDFIINATGLTTYYDINPETQNVLTTADYPLVTEDDTLQGLFRVSPLALYINRTNFTTSKHDILYIASDDLFNNFNGTYKNYIQLHEKPVADDNERKRFTQFSSDMSFECELNGRVEVTFRRGTLEPTAWRYAMLILDVERIPVKQL